MTTICSIFWFLETLLAPESKTASLKCVKLKLDKKIISCTVKNANHQQNKLYCIDSLKEIRLMFCNGLLSRTLCSRLSS